MCCAELLVWWVSSVLAAVANLPLRPIACTVFSTRTSRAQVSRRPRLHLHNTLRSKSSNEARRVGPCGDVTSHSFRSRVLRYHSPSISGDLGRTLIHASLTKIAGDFVHKPSIQVIAKIANALCVSIEESIK